MLLVDETKLSDKLNVMVVGLAYPGRCYPPTHPARSGRNCRGRGRGVVQADQGIGTSPALVRAVWCLGGHSLFRVHDH